MHRTMYKTIAILLFIGTLAMAFGSCVDDPQQGLRIMGSVERDECREFDTSKPRTSGYFDLKANEYAQVPYYLDIWVMNDLYSNAYEARNRGEGNWVTLRRFEIEFEVPGGWPTDPPLPSLVIDRGQRLDPQSELILIDVPVINQQVIDTIQTIYIAARTQASSTVNEGELASILLKIKAYGDNSAGQEISSNTFYFTVDVCNGCLLEDEKYTCCTTPWGSETTSQAYDDYVEDLETLNVCTRAGRQVFTQDTILYCSWFSECFNSMGCCYAESDTCEEPVSCGSN